MSDSNFSISEDRTETLTRAAPKERNRIQFRRTERLPVRRPSYAVPSAVAAVPLRSRTTALVFQAILGAAACLALVAVVSATQEQVSGGAVDPSSPDAPPPAVFVHLGD